MKTIEVAIDDYMHVIARTRPWSMKREGEILEAFSEWLYEQPEQRVMLDEVTGEQVQQYAATTGVSDEEQQELTAVLNNLYLWADKQGWTTLNPFDRVTA